MKRSSMRVPIPAEMREQLADDPFMQRCILDNVAGTFCEGRIEWDHSFTYAGKRINEPWALLPVCHAHHMQEASWRTIKADRMISRIHHFGAEEEFKRKYPKSLLV